MARNIALLPSQNLADMHIIFHYYQKQKEASSGLQMLMSLKGRKICTI